MTVKERLHELVDHLQEGAPVEAAERMLMHLSSRRDDPVLQALVDAPEDDEPESREEAAAISEARGALRAQDAVSQEDIRRELGL